MKENWRLSWVHTIIWGFCIHFCLQLPNPQWSMECMKNMDGWYISSSKLCVVALPPPLLVLLLVGALQAHPRLAGPHRQARRGLLWRSQGLLLPALLCRRPWRCCVPENPVDSFPGKCDNRLGSGELPLLLSSNHSCRDRGSETCASSHWVAVRSWNRQRRRLDPEFVESWTKRSVGRRCHQVHRTIVHLDELYLGRNRQDLTPEKVGDDTLA